MLNCVYAFSRRIGMGMHATRVLSIWFLPREKNTCMESLSLDGDTRN